MLKGIDPILGPDLLRVLAAMGHGDEVVIADANFPAEANARRLVRLDGVDATRTAEAILSLLPLDEYVEAPAAVMAVVGDPEAELAIVADFRRIAETAHGAPVGLRGWSAWRSMSGRGRPSRSWPRASGGPTAT